MALSDLYSFRQTNIPMILCMIPEDVVLRLRLEMDNLWVEG